MNGRWLYVVVAGLAAIVLAGNYALVHSQGGCPSPGNCQCVVTMSRSGVGKSTKPSCSVTWKFGFATALSNCDIVEPGMFDRIVMCDTGIKAKLKCRGGEYTVGGGTASRVSCDESGTYPTIKVTHEDSWVNNVGNRNTNQSQPVHRAIARFLGADAAQRHGLLTETELITVFDGDAGVTTSGGVPVVMVTAGEAQVESFCDGSVARFAAPAIIRLPTTVGSYDLLGGGTAALPRPCTVDDLTGRWRGVYSRPNRTGPAEGVSLLIDIRGNAGTVQIPDATLDLEEFRPGGSSLFLRAKARSGSGSLVLQGTVDKGSMSLKVEEAGLGPDGRRYSSGTGFADRLYIAHWAVSKAAVNTPYRHALFAVSPAGGNLLWSVAGGKLPDGISLDGATGVLSGIPTATGDFEFTVEVRDSNSDTFRQPFTLTVADMMLVTTLLPDAYLGQPYRFKLEMAGGQPPYKWTNMLAIPFPIPGMPVMPQVSEDGEVTISETGASIGTLMLEVRDSAGKSKMIMPRIQTRGLTIQGSQILPQAAMGTAYRYQFTALGATGTVTWSVRSGDLDECGLKLDPATGELSGTPSLEATGTIRVTARDGKATHSRDFVLTIGGAGAAAAGRNCPSCKTRSTE